MARIIDAPLTASDGAGCDPRAVHGTWGALDAAARRGLAYTPKSKPRPTPLYERVKHVIPAIEWPAYAPLISAINKMKREKNAVILAHNYMTSEIFHCVGDFRGDSLQLAREAAETDADIIVQAGVHFMAETSKILAPEKTVLIPDMRAGCSLAASITGADVRLIKQRYPGRAGRDLREHLGRRESRERRLLHVVERRGRGRMGGARMEDRPRHPDAGRISGQERRRADRHQDHRLARPLRSA